MRVLIVSGLVQFGGRTARATLEGALDGPDETVRTRAAEALAGRQRPRSIG